MRHAAALLAILVAATAAAQDAPVLKAYIDGEVVDSAIRIDASRMTGTPPVVWIDEIADPDADYIRLFFRVEGDGFPPDAFIRLVDRFDRETDIRLADIGADGLWSGIFLGGRVRMALVSAAVPPNAAMVIDRIARQSDRAALFSTHGANDIRRINHESVPDNVRALAPPVAFLSFVAGGHARTCSGFLIADDLILTNEHCIDSAETCRTMTAVFGYEHDADNRLRMGPQRRCIDFDPALSSIPLDVSAIRLNAPPGADYGAVPIPAVPPRPDGPLFIIQHPGPHAKHVSIVDCAAVALNVKGREDEVTDGDDGVTSSEDGVSGQEEGTDFTHTCDTAGGSSGSPVFNKDGVLVGIHHFGFAEDPTGTWSENRGVHGDRIAAWAAATLPPAAEDEPSLADPPPPADTPVDE